jgi:hypothetical protein
MPKGSSIALSIINETGEALPEPVDLDWEDANSIWDDADAIERAAWIQKGFVASCVEVKYGESSLEAFAREKDVSLTTVNNYRRVYRRVARLDADFQPDVLRGVSNGALTYSHLLSANKLDDEDYAEVLGEALSEGWGKRRVAEEVAVRTEQQSFVQRQQELQEEEGVQEYVEKHETCPWCEGSGIVRTRFFCDTEQAQSRTGKRVVGRR